MRNLFRALLVIGALAPLHAASAQTTFGIKGGLSFATLSNKHPDWDNRTGFAAGVALDMRAGPIGIQPEVLYVQKGVKSDGSPDSDAPKLDYIEVPILLKVTIPIPAIQPFVYAGPSIGFRLTCKVGEIDCDSDAVKSTDFGAALGGGIRLGGNKGITLEGRYMWGLKDLNKLNSGVETKTRTFLVMAGVSL
ncbi:MAG: porin family protein [Gemmatimonadales bacterium]